MTADPTNHASGQLVGKGVSEIYARRDWWRSTSGKRTQERLSTPWARSDFLVGTPSERCEKILQQLDVHTGLVDVHSGLVVWSMSAIIGEFLFYP